MSWVEDHRRLVSVAGGLLGFGVLSAVFFATNRPEFVPTVIGGRNGAWPSM